MCVAHIDFACSLFNKCENGVLGNGKITKEMADIALNRLEIDKLGLTVLTSVSSL